MSEFSQGNYEWGCIGTDINTSHSLGSGLSNTQLILNNCSQRPIAASIAYDYNGSGFNDWFLPSTNEVFEYLNNVHLPLLYSNNGSIVGWTSVYYDNSNYFSFRVTAGSL